MHPEQALFEGEKTTPNIASCEHFAGNEKLILKSLELQKQLGPVFDITCDCEDGAAAGQELQHVEMIAQIIASDLNHLGQVGVRIHDPMHPHWQKDVDVILEGCGNRLAYITIPKVTSAQMLADTIEHIQKSCASHGIDRHIPIHALIETHGALAEVTQIAALPWMQVLDFGQMDFVSAHHGAIQASAMQSPMQFEHPLLMRAKAEIAAAAHANGLIPSHNVCLNLNDPEIAFGDAERARNDFGFLRMWSIHPKQIMPIVKAMGPNLDDVNDAAGILLQAQANNWGPIQYKGQLNDRATYRYYWQVLKRAKMANTVIPLAADTAFFAD